MTDKPLFTEADIIYSYTRAEAIADGVLKDLTKLAQEAGLKLPVAITAAAWNAAIDPPADCPEQSIEGRAWDVLNVFRFQAISNAEADRVDFVVSVRVSPTTFAAVCLRAQIHSGDSGEPVITILLPYED